MIHKVNKLKFDIECATESQAFDIRQRIVHLQDDIMESIDHVASHFIGETDLVHIERVEIDLGDTSFQAFSNRLADDFRIIFEKSLLQQLGQRLKKNTSSSFSDNQLQAFLYFLETGSLPWWAADDNPDMDEVFKEILKIHSETFIAFLYNSRQNSRIWKRIAFQFKKESKSQLLNMVQVFKPVRGLIINRLTNEQGLLHLNITAMNTEELIDELLLYNASSILDEYDHTDTIEHILQQLKWTFNNHVVPGEYPFELEAAKSSKYINSKLENSESTLDDTDKPGVHYKIKYSGIVIAAPFLPALFEKLGLVKDGEFESWSARCKAVHLVASMATGTTKNPEYVLTLAKILCGMEAEDPIPYHTELDIEEISEINELLSSIVFHWKALKNTSVDGLRENFFKRDGTLQKTTNGWLLRVEQKSWDALLLKVNWGFSTLAFPWNNYLVTVEWPI